MLLVFSQAWFFFFLYGNVSSLVTPSAFHRNVSASTPGFSPECRMENVQLSFFPHFSPPRRSPRDSLAPQKDIFRLLVLKAPGLEWTRGKDFVECAQVSLTHFTVPLHPDFISPCPRNPPAITPPSFGAETHFLAVRPLGASTFDSARDKKRAPSFSAFSSWVCHILLPASPTASVYRLTQMKDLGGTEGELFVQLYEDAAVWSPLGGGEMIQMQSFWLS